LSPAGGDVLLDEVDAHAARQEEEDGVGLAARMLAISAA